MSQKRPEDISPEAAKRRLKYLGSPGRTTRVGTPSNRNLAKPYKAPRIIEDKVTGEVKYHPLDMMKGANGRLEQTNGRVGIVSTFQGAGATGKREDAEKYGHFDNVNNYVAARMLDRSKAKGKQRNPKPRKLGGKSMPTIAQIQSQSIKYLTNLRSAMLSALAVEEISGEKNLIDDDSLFILGAINDFLRQHLSREEKIAMDKADKNRISSMRGQYHAGKIKVASFRSEGQRIKRALMQLNERPEPIHPNSVHPSKVHYEPIKQPEYKQDPNFQPKSIVYAMPKPPKPTE